MRATSVLCFAVLTWLRCASIGQEAGGQPRPPDGGTREVLVSILIPSLPNAPFSAMVNTESIRMLADGTSITLKNRRVIARDNAGRIFQERRLLVPEDGKHESIVTQIEISDPVAHELYICKPREGVCQVERFSAPNFVPPVTSAATGEPPGSPSREPLGEHAIEGLETVGTRETTIIPAGAIGNNSPIEVSREYWYSPQLGVNLISKLQDPRVGTQNFSVTDVALGEPDAKLFQLPSHVRLIDLRSAPVAAGPPLHQPRN
jgi:hypothetical protein